MATHRVISYHARIHVLAIPSNRRPPRLRLYTLLVVPSRLHSVQGRAFEGLAHMHGTILIVDDDVSILDTARLVLGREGYRVLTASDGEAAIQLMTAGDSAANVSTLLCDLGMPNMGGNELIEHFRMHFPSIPIIVMSGASDMVFLDGIVQRGVCDWLRKPVTREALLEKVRTASNLFALRQQHR